MTMGNLDKQFAQNLGFTYEQHKDLFFDFFYRIQSYLFGEKTLVNDIVDSFFDKLLLRMTQILLNLKPSSNMLFAKCFSSRLKTKQPFENIPTIIAKMTKEAFPPIRLAINAMAVAHEALITAAKPVRLVVYTLTLIFT